MHKFLFLGLLLLSACASRHIWDAPHFYGKTKLGSATLSDVDIFVQYRGSEAKKFLGKSDERGKFNLEPIGHSFRCFLITCMGDPYTRGQYFFEKSGFESVVIPFNYFTEVASPDAPEKGLEEVVLQPVAH